MTTDSLEHDRVLVLNWPESVRVALSLVSGVGGWLVHPEAPTRFYERCPWPLPPRCGWIPADPCAIASAAARLRGPQWHWNLDQGLRWGDGGGDLVDAALVKQFHDGPDPILKLSPTCPSGRLAALHIFEWAFLHRGEDGASGIAPLPDTVAEIRDRWDSWLGAEDAEDPHGEEQGPSCASCHRDLYLDPEMHRDDWIQGVMVCHDCTDLRLSAAHRDITELLDVIRDLRSRLPVG